MDTEEEQVEKLKTWLKQNGLSIVLGVVIGGGSIVGYRFWIDMQETQARLASDQFAQMITALNAADDDSIEVHAANLIENHADSEYALMAQLALAKKHVRNAEYDLAEASLQHVIGTAAQEPLAYLARTRLASVQYQKTDYDKALSTLSVDFPAEFLAGVDELRGDILSSQGKADEAASAYRKALSAIPGPVNGDFVQQKLDDLGVAG